MNVVKKRKIDRERCIFNNNLISEYFVTEVEKKAACLLCCESVSVLKDYNIICYYVTKHAHCVNILSAEPRQTREKYLDKKLVKQKDFLRKDKKETELSYSYQLYSYIKHC
ncbi:General transcription factor II-I repeat domain-containing protein 2 [Thelohanellus kitauei]|uniref:General transcription factor II-I repeat domain-containing protein 2 n=1 Tax=Thelohanellus kitauei TaxID=669202 RepID=A0A0C2MH67_THEKT|nr:General transcription factor II-I repeat domain-containing protein 2 [Thelohanellus kitauei]